MLEAMQMPSIDNAILAHPTGEAPPKAEEAVLVERARSNPRAFGTMPNSSRPSSRDGARLSRPSTANTARSTCTGSSCPMAPPEPMAPAVLPQKKTSLRELSPDPQGLLLFHFAGLYHCNPKRKRGTFPRIPSLTLRVSIPLQTVQLEQSKSPALTRPILASCAQGHGQPR